MEYFIRRCRYSEALEWNDKHFVSNIDSEEDQRRINILKNIRLCMPPSLRSSFRVSGPKPQVAKESAEERVETPAVLSQSRSLRGKSFTQQDLLHALHENYVQKVENVEKETIVQQQFRDISMDLDRAFDQENGIMDELRPVTPSKPAGSPAIPITSVVRVSSPFVKQPYTPPVGIAIQYLLLTVPKKDRVWLPRL